MLAEALATCNAHLQVLFQKLEWDQCEIGLKVLKMLERERSTEWNLPYHRTLQLDC